MAYDVTVKIDLAKPVGSLGFGIPLILEDGATPAKSYTECASLADVVAAGFADTTNVYKAAQLLLMQENAPQKFAVCATESAADWLSDVDNVTKDWRQLIIVGDKSVGGIAGIVETLEGKLFFASVGTSDYSGGGGAAGMERTVLFVVDETTACPVPQAALVGATAGLAAGSFTYKNVILKGVEPQKLADTVVENIHKAGGLTFLTKAGDNVTSEGKVVSGEYIDIVDSKDYVIQQIKYKVQKTLNTLPKLPFDNVGISILESVVNGVLKDCYNKGIIATGDDGKPAYSVNFLTRDQIPAEDRADRRYGGGNFSFQLAGAIHNVDVVGEIII